MSLRSPREWITFCTSFMHSCSVTGNDTNRYECLPKYYELASVTIDKLTSMSRGRFWCCKTENGVRNLTEITSKRQKSFCFKHLIKFLACKKIKNLTDGYGVAQKPIQSCSLRRGLRWKDFPYASLCARQVQRQAFNYLTSKWFVVLEGEYELCLIMKHHNERLTRLHAYEKLKIDSYCCEEIMSFSTPIAKPRLCCSFIFYNFSFLCEIYK